MLLAVGQDDAEPRARAEEAGDLVGISDVAELERRADQLQRSLPTLGRRLFAALLLGGSSLPALAACDPGGVGELFVSDEEVERLGLET